MPASWQTWKDETGEAVIVQGDADWGKLVVLGHQYFSTVRDIGNTSLKRFKVTQDKYGTGLGSVVISIRGQATAFNQLDASPDWEVYSGQINRTWRFVQIKISST